MINKYVDKDESILFTDDYKGYRKIDEIIEYVKIDHHKMYSYKGINTNTIESFWAIVKRQIIGQHHHVSVKHLPKYVPETVFKFNNRNDDDMFETLVKFSMLTN
ncbi:MAG: transposase [Bacteroidetes bacterium]|nr:transposase [Bacteroidota bacterium]